MSEGEQVLRTVAPAMIDLAEENERLRVEIGRLRAEAMRLCDVLREVHDFCERPWKHEERWEAAMEKAIAILKEHNA